MFLLFFVIVLYFPLDRVLFIFRTLRFLRDKKVHK